MGYRITYKDIVIEVDTLLEFENALNVCRGLDAKHKTAPPPEPPNRTLLPPEEALEKVTTTSKMVRVYRSLLPGHGRNMINALYDKVEGLTSEELQKILNINPGGLGGALGGITKAAMMHGLYGSDIISRPRELGGRYQLTEAMRKVLQGEMDQKIERKART
jgi:hypothetical protein